MEFTGQLLLLALLGMTCGVLAEGLSIDEQIKNASNNTESFNFFWSEVGHLALVEYDIVVPQGQWLAEHSTNHRDRRATGLNSKHWRGGVVYYQFKRNAFGYWEEKRIRDAMSAWEAVTCLRFVESTTNRNRIRIIKDNGCYSYVGEIGGVQDLSLGNGCVYHDIILHEFGHAVGLHHEQNHPDRDNYVRINLQNVASGMRHNFDKLSHYNVQQDGQVYDYRSIMHYSGTAFSTNGQLTIQTLNSAYQNVIGSAKSLSSSDINTVKAMYNC